MGTHLDYLQQRLGIVNFILAKTDNKKTPATAFKAIQGEKEIDFGNDAVRRMRGPYLDAILRIVKAGIDEGDLDTLKAAVDFYCQETTRIAKELDDENEGIDVSPMPVYETIISFMESSAAQKKHFEVIHGLAGHITSLKEMYLAPSEQLQDILERTRKADARAIENFTLWGRFRSIAENTSAQGMSRALEDLEGSVIRADAEMIADRSSIAKRFGRLFDALNRLPVESEAQRDDLHNQAMRIAFRMAGRELDSPAAVKPEKLADILERYVKIFARDAQRNPGIAIDPIAEKPYQHADARDVLLIDLGHAVLAGRAIDGNRTPSGFPIAVFRTENGVEWDKTHIRYRNSSYTPENAMQSLNYCSTHAPGKTRIGTELANALAGAKLIFEGHNATPPKFPNALSYVRSRINHYEQPQGAA